MIAGLLKQTLWRENVNKSLQIRGLIQYANFIGTKEIVQQKESKIEINILYKYNINLNIGLYYVYN